MNYEIFFIFIGLFLSAFFSASETAFTAAGRLVIEVFRRHQRKGAYTAAKLHANPTLLFSTTLVGNNLANVISSSFAALYLQLVGIPILWILLISPMVILVFGEILPKSIVREHPERWALRTSRPLYFIYRLLFPLVITAQASSQAVLFLLGTKQKMHLHNPITVADIKSIWSDLRRYGALDKAEVELLNRAIHFKNLKLREIMTPRAKIIGLPIHTSIQTVKDLVRSTGFSRIPVYEGDLDHIKGILRAKDLLGNPLSLADILQSPLFIPQQQRADHLLDLFKQEKMGMAIVIDEFGGVVGMITIEDLLEELVGEIQDEHEFKFPIGRQLARGVVLLPGRTSLENIDQAYGIELPAGDYESIGGLIVSHFGRIPLTGETLQLEKCSITVATADERRIKRVLLRLL